MKHPGHMVRDARQCRAPHHEVSKTCAELSDLILRSREAASRRMGHGLSWFETALTRLLTMRIRERKRELLHQRRQLCTFISHEHRDQFGGLGHAGIG